MTRTRQAAAAQLEHHLAEGYEQCREKFPAQILPAIERLEVRYADGLPILIVDVAPRAAASMIGKFVGLLRSEMTPVLLFVGVEMITVLGSGMPCLVHVKKPAEEMN